MEYYQLDPDAFERMKWRVVWYTLPLLAIVGGGVVWIAASWRPQLSVLRVLVAISIIVLATASGLWQNLKAKRAAWRSFRLGLDEAELVREEIGMPTVTIPRSDVESMTEKPGGLLVKSRRSFIFIPTALRGYGEVLDALRHWGSVRTRPSTAVRALVIRYLVGALAVAAFAAVCVLENPYAVASIGLAFCVGSVWSFAVIQKSQHVEWRAKRAAYWLILPLLAVLVKTVYCLMKLAG